MGQKSLCRFLLSYVLICSIYMFFKMLERIAFVWRHQWLQKPQIIRNSFPILRKKDGGPCQWQKAIYLVHLVHDNVKQGLQHQRRHIASVSLFTFISYFPATSLSTFQLWLSLLLYSSCFFSFIHYSLKSSLT